VSSAAFCFPSVGFSSSISAGLGHSVSSSSSGDSGSGDGDLCNASAKSYTGKNESFRSGSSSKHMLLDTDETEDEECAGKTTLESSGDDAVDDGGGEKVTGANDSYLLSMCDLGIVDS
jgi:hypothetical protein